MPDPRLPSELEEIAGDIPILTQGLPQLRYMISNLPPLSPNYLPGVAPAMLPESDGTVASTGGTGGTGPVAGSLTVGDGPGTVPGSTLVPRSVPKAAFAASLRPPSIWPALPLPTLPDPAYPIGSLIYLTSESKLYRNPDDVAWTAAIILPDGLGQITTTQIADLAISTPKLMTGAVQTEQLAAYAVTADKIEANTITAGQIAAGAISADELASKVILGTKAIIAGDPDAAHVELTGATGMTNYDANLDPTVKIPTDGSPVWVKGEIEANSIVSEGAELRGDTSFPGSSVATLQVGITDPVSPPSIIASTPSDTIASVTYPGHGLAYTASGGTGGATAVYWVGGDPTVGTFLDMAYEISAADGSILRTIQKTGAEQILTDVEGSTSHISDQATLRQGATYSQIATPITMRSDRGTMTITKVSVYMAGNGGACSTRNCLWNSSGVLLSDSDTYSATSRTFANGNSDKYDKALTPAYAVAAGTTVWAGFCRTNTSDYSQWDQDNGSGKTEKRGDSNIGDMTSIETFSSTKPNVYVTYTYVANSSEEGTTGKIVGVCKAGSYVWCLDANGMLFKYNNADLDYLGKVDLSAYIAGTKANAGLFYDGTNLVITTATGVSGTDQVRLVKADASTGAWVSTHATTGNAINGSTATVRGGGLWTDNADSVSKYWVSINGVVQAYKASDYTYSSNRSFGQSSECLSGVTHNGTSWRGWTSADKTKLFSYTGWDWTTASAVYWICYAWYKSTTTTRETAVSPRATLTLGRRRQLTITTPALPTGTGDVPDKVRVYAMVGAADPGSGANAYYLQVEDALTSRTRTSYAGSGTQNVGSNTFPAGTAAELKSSVAGWSLKGDGTAFFRNIAMPAPLAAVSNGLSGTVLNLTVPQALQSSFLIVQTSSAGSADVSSISQTNVTWTKIRSYGSSTARQEVWKGIPTGTPGTTCTVTWGTSTSNVGTYSEWPASAGLAGTLGLYSESGGTQSYAVGGFIVGGDPTALTLVTVGSSSGTIKWGSLPGPYNTLGVADFCVHGYAWMGGQASYCRIGNVTSSVFAGMMIEIT